jgi:hypothetical protein
MLATMARHFADLFSFWFAVRSDRGWLAGPNRLGSGPTGGVSPLMALGPPATVDLLFQTNDALFPEMQTTPLLKI